MLSTESIEDYNAILSFCVDSVRPKDFIEQMFVRDVVDASWEIRRYVRHKSLAIERTFHGRIENLTQIESDEAKKPHAYRQEKTANMPETDLDRAGELENVVDKSIDDVDKILLRKPADLDHSRALEAGIEFHEKLDRLLNAAVARRDNALEQLERYRNGLGQHLRRVSDEVIDAEFNETSNDARQVSLVDAIEGAG